MRKKNCKLRSQDCTVKAPYLLFLHSTYDMTITDIADSMTSSNALEGVGSFIFNTIILEDDSGMLPGIEVYFEKYEVGGKLRIRFFFF